MNYKEYAKTWIDANVHDGEDRSGCKSDWVKYDPDSLQELIDDLLDDLIPKAMEEHEKALQDKQDKINVFADAMSEIKATTEGNSKQPVKDIIRGCIDELKSLSATHYRG